jgi:hypothetical protein
MQKGDGLLLVHEKANHYLCCMIIGSDFEKMSVKWGDLIILEPNTFLTDTMMALICFYLAIKVWKSQAKNPFVNWFLAFFFMLGISTFTGGLGHAFYHYWGTPGKLMGWYSAVLSVFFIERAMISYVYNEKLQKLYRAFSILKMISVYAILTLLCLTKNVMDNPDIGFLPVAINTIAGTLLSAGILGYVFYRIHEAPFHYFTLGVVAMLPAAFFFLMKINIHPWFDKNDVSHIFLSVGNVFFYIGISKVSSELYTKFNIESVGSNN